MRMEGDVYSSLLNLKEKIKKIPKDELANCLDNYHLDPDFMKLKEQISSQITYETAKMTHPDDKTPFISNKIHYMSLYEDSDGYFCAGIFFVPKGHALPLHDHTGMLVISKVLRGEVQINSYDKKFPKDTSLTNFQVCPPTSNVLKMNDMNALTPSVRNFHDLVAIEDVVLFDALLPDYDKLLGCNYYQTYKKKGKLYLKLLDKF